MLKHPLSAVNSRKAGQAKHILKYILIQTRFDDLPQLLARTA